MSLTPYFVGDTSIAKGIVDGERCVMLMLGDSLTLAQCPAIYRMWALPKVTGVITNAAGTNETGTGFAATAATTCCGRCGRATRRI